jgi:hypothetical protein
VVLLLDYIYKTNRFGMALLNIRAIIGGNIVVQVRLAFNCQEREVNYNWSLEFLYNIMAKESIPEPL